MSQFFVMKIGIYETSDSVLCMLRNIPCLLRDNPNILFYVGILAESLFYWKFLTF